MENIFINVKFLINGVFYFFFQKEILKLVYISKIKKIIIHILLYFNSVNLPLKVIIMSIYIKNYMKIVCKYNINYTRY